MSNVPFPSIEPAVLYSMYLTETAIYTGIYPAIKKKNLPTAEAMPSLIKANLENSG